MTSPGRRLPALMVAVALLAGALAACTATGGKADGPIGTTPTTAGSDRPTTTAGGGGEAGGTGTLDWTDCDDRYQCAELEVPLDHDDPDGEQLTLALVRHPAEDPDRRIGSLVVNPGGPGGSAIETVESLPLAGDIEDRFDIVGFDPRGVGRSSPLDCHSHLRDIYDADPTMEDQADVDHYLKVSQEFVDECEAKYADLLPHLGTVDVAKDMDLVRQALGDDQLTYLGYSYGTSIGQQYARLFPTKVRAMVLDGVVDPSKTGLQGAADQAAGFNRALGNWEHGCDTDGCGLDEDAKTALDQVIADSERTPIPTSDPDRPATPGVVNLAVGQALYSEYLWPDLGRALQDALAADGDGLVELAEYYLGGDGDGGYDNGFEIYFAVSCLDSEWPSDPKAILAEAKKVGAEYPEVGEGLVNDYVRCALWPTPPQPLEPVPTDLEGLAPIVLISTTGDPATPYEDGVAVAKRIPGARLITNEGEGHTIYAQGKSCVDDAVDAYFLDLELPDDGLTC